MRISAKVDYAVRATLELARSDGEPVKGEKIADAQAIPLKFLENILGELKHSGIVQSRRGANGGYWLIRDLLDGTTIADIVADELPEQVRELSEPAEAWSPR